MKMSFLIPCERVVWFQYNPKYKCTLLLVVAQTHFQGPHRFGTVPDWLLLVYIHMAAGETKQH